ncbi:phytoene desaturase family protein [Anatilimnocola floriformis]|uniref:phytoene desaturase family protein n=1 Tax=Anatilimnocola floriformis TaxID=2948575 RepID=UPI0020C41E7B|nr:FAD-dependent oxidoreductase [Anatilimnocola floriformis]
MFNSQQETKRTDVAVVGGGLAGMMAATKLARAGKSVVLLEQSKHLGGRAATNDVSSVQFNLGPHALYCHGHAFRLLREMEVPFSGHFPNPGTGLAVYRERNYRLPRGFKDLLLTGLLSWRDKWRLSSFFSELPKIDTSSLQSTSVREWVNDRFGRGTLAEFLCTMFRLTSYAADMEHYSAGAALDQFIMGLGNVWYIDHGWQTLIDNLRAVAVTAGAKVRSAAHVVAVRPDANGVSLQLTNGEMLSSGAAVLAVGPQKVAELLALPKEHSLSQWTANARPVRAACLDIALTKLPRPQHRFALGVDHAYYFSVHSAVAELGPEGLAVIHVAKYLSAGESGPVIEQELEKFLDQVQPGWRSLVHTRRYLPSMLVAPDVPQAAVGGLKGRPAVDVLGTPGVFVAGDWVGPRGQLADASAASAEEAADRVLQFQPKPAPAKLQYA